MNDVIKGQEGLASGMTTVSGSFRIIVKCSPLAPQLSSPPTLLSTWSGSFLFPQRKRRGQGLHFCFFFLQPLVFLLFTVWSLTR